MDLTQLWRLPATRLAAGYRAGSFSPADVVRACLQRMAQCEPLLHAMVCVDAAGALAAAEASAARWRGGTPAGPLDGVPFTVKDNLHAAGLPTRWGSLLLRDAPQPQDEAPVRRLREAGAILLGKTNLPPFALQGFTASAMGGRTRNPRAPALTPGGSSGGAAASVAAGYAPLAVATDGGGSIRRPAAYCGVLGYKPSEGLVPRAGGLPDLFDGHEVVGGFTRSLADLRLLTEALAGRSLPPPAASGAARILFLPRLGARPVDRGIADAVRGLAHRLREQGHQVTEGEGALTAWAERVHALWPRLGAAGLAWMFEQAGRWPALFGEAEGDGSMGMAAACDEATRSLYLEGRGMPAASLYELADAVAELRHTLAALFAGYDYLLTPATSARAWPVESPCADAIDGQSAGPRSDAVFTPFANAAGLCALSLPCRLVEGLPVSCQLVAPQGEDARLLAFAGPLAGFADGLPLAEPETATP